MIQQIETAGRQPGGKGRFQNHDDGTTIAPLAPHGKNDRSPHDREQVLAWLRALSLRARMFVGEIDLIGTNLKVGVVSPEEALDWLDELHPPLLEMVEANR